MTNLPRGLLTLAYETPKASDDLSPLSPVLHVPQSAHITCYHPKCILHICSCCSRSLESLFHLSAWKTPIHPSKHNTKHTPFSVKSFFLLETHLLTTTSMLQHVHSHRHKSMTISLGPSIAFYIVLQSKTHHTVLPSQLVTSFFLHLTVSSLRIKRIHP